MEKIFHQERKTREMFVFLLMFPVLFVGIASGNRVLHRQLADATTCPLNFSMLQQVVLEHPTQQLFVDIQTECLALVKAVRMIRSDYLRRTGNFSFSPDASSSCWDIFESLLNQYIPAFDARSNCGFQTQWISSSCMNMSTRSDFEARVPKSQLQEVNRWCNQSLGDVSSCLQCNSSLLNIKSTLFGGSDLGNESDCGGFPFMYAAAFVNQFGPTDLGTAKCLFSIEFNTATPGTNKKHKIVIRGVIAGCVIGFFAIITVVWLIWRQHKANCERKNHNAKLLATRASTFLGETTTLIKFDIEELKESTMNFSRSNLIGTGGFGNVYKAVLADGSEVALKRFKNCSVAGDENFTHEVEVIASIRHVNIVALRGYSTATTPLEGHQRIIVCDFVRNGSLYDHLFGQGAKRLNWSIRKKIALGIARGLAYLHTGVQPGIIHRDIKASNILLDETFEPKLADFGLAKFTPDGVSHVSTRVAGTLGYVCPEYALYGRLTEKSDVYSFGVVLLELLSGKKAVIRTNDDQVLLLTDWAWSLVKQGRALDVVEGTMPEIGPSEIMEKYVLVAILSAHPSLDARPTMEQIVNILESDNGTIPAIPDHPFPIVAKIDDIERSLPFSNIDRSLSFTSTDTMLNSADQFSEERYHSVSDHRKIEQDSLGHMV